MAEDRETSEGPAPATRALAAIRDLDERAGCLEPGGLALDAAGRPVRRPRRRPLAFSFRWRGTNFQGRVEDAGACLRLRLLADLHVVPYTSEDAARRTRLLAWLAAADCGRAGQLALGDNHLLVLANDIEIPRAGGRLDTTIVANIAILVLLGAPHIARLAPDAETPPDEVSRFREA